MADRRLELSINLKVETERARQQLASLGAVPLRVDVAAAINQLREARIPVRLDSSGISATGIGRTIGDEILNSLKNFKPGGGGGGFLGNILGGIKDLIAAPFEAVFRGAFEGVGRELTRDLSKGISQGINRELAPIIGSFEFIGREGAAALVRELRLELSQEAGVIRKTISDLIGEAPLMAETGAVLSQQRRQQDRRTVEGTRFFDEERQTLDQGQIRQQLQQVGERGRRLRAAQVALSAEIRKAATAMGADKLEERISALRGQLQEVAGQAADGGATPQTVAQVKSLVTRIQTLGDALANLNDLARRRYQDRIDQLAQFSEKVAREMAEVQELQRPLEARLVLGRTVAPGQVDSSVAASRARLSRLQSLQTERGAVVERANAADTTRIREFEQVREAILARPEGQRNLSDLASAETMITRLQQDRVKRQKSIAFIEQQIADEQILLKSLLTQQRVLAERALRGRGAAVSTPAPVAQPAAASVATAATPAAKLPESYLQVLELVGLASNRQIPSNLAPRLRVDKKMSGSVASYNPIENQINLSKEVYEGLQSGNLSDKGLEQLIHELRHALQLGPIAGDRSVDLLQPVGREMATLQERIDRSVANYGGTELTVQRVRDLETDAYVFADRMMKAIAEGVDDIQSYVSRPTAQKQEAVQREDKQFRAETATEQAQKIRADSPPGGSAGAIVVRQAAEIAHAGNAVETALAVTARGVQSGGRAVYKALETVEKIVFDFIPGANTAKAFGKNVAIPAATFAAASQIPVVGQMAHMAMSAGSGLISPLLQAGGQALAGSATQFISGAVPHGMWGAQALAGNLSGAATQIIGGVTDGLTQIVPQAITAVVGGRALLNAPRAAVRAIQGSQPMALPGTAQPFSLPPAKEAELQIIEESSSEAAQRVGKAVVQAGKQIAEGAAEKIRDISQLASAEAIKAGQKIRSRTRTVDVSAEVVADPWEGAALPPSRETTDLGRLRQLAQGGDARAALGLAGEVKARFQNARAKINQLIEAGQTEAAQEMAASFVAGANAAYKELTQTLEQVKAQGTKIEFGNELATAIGQLKSLLNRQSQALRKAGLARVKDTEELFGDFPEVEDQGFMQRAGAAIQPSGSSETLFGFSELGQEAAALIAQLRAILGRQPRLNPDQQQRLAELEIETRPLGSVLPDYSNLGESAPAAARFDNVFDQESRRIDRIEAGRTPREKIIDVVGVEVGKSARAAQQGLIGLTAALPKTRQQLEGAAKAAGMFKQGLDFLLANIKQVAVAYLAFSVFDPQALISFGQAAVQSAVRLEQLTTALNNSSGGAEQGAAQLAFVRSEVDRLALPLEASVAGFTQLTAATRGTSLEGERTQKMFSALAQAGRVNALTQEQMQRVFLATSQVMSKGTVAAEEIRGQIGEVLPGAFQTFARALGISTEQLSKRLEQGQVGLEDFYKFSQQLAAQTAGGVAAANQTTAASLQRLGTAWEKSMGGLGAAVLPVVSAIAEGLVSALEIAGNIAAGVGDAFGLLVAGMQRVGSLVSWLVGGLDKLSGGALSAVGNALKAVVSNASVTRAVFTSITLVVMGQVIPALVTFAVTTIPTVITALSALAVKAGLSLAALGPYAIAIAAIAAAALAARPVLDGLADAMDGVNAKALEQGQKLDNDYNAALDKLQRGVPLTAEALKSLTARLRDTAINGGMSAKGVAVLTQNLENLQQRALRAAQIQAQINQEIANSERAFKLAGNAIETSYLKAQAELIEAQNAGLINADRVRIETLQIEQQKSRDLIAATEQREAEITAIIQKYEFLRSVKGSLTDDERKRLEEQQEQLTQIIQQQYRARADIARRETEIATQIIIGAEKARNAEIERLRIDDLINAEQADLAVLQSRRKQIEERIELEGQTHDLVLEWLDNERQQQEALTRAIQAEIQQRADAVKRGFEAEQLYYRENIIAIERQQTALDALTRVYEQQNQLLEARGSLAAAVRDLGEGEFDIRQRQLQEESKAIDEQAARLSEMATTDEERAAIQTSAEFQKKQIQEQSDALAKESARFRLQALQLEQEIETQKLALQRQQNAAALERERIALRIAQAENQSAQAQNKADIAQSQADIAKIQSDQTLTPEQRQAALAAANLQLQANQIEGLALQDKNAALGIQGALIDQQAMVDQQVQAMQALTLNLQQLAQRRGLQQEAGLPIERMPGSPQELLGMSPQQLAAARGATAGQFIGQPQQLPGHRNLAMEAAAAAQQQHQALMRGIVPVSMLQSAPPVTLAPAMPGVNSPQPSGLNTEVLNAVRQIFPPINQMIGLLQGINTATSATASRPNAPITVVQDFLDRNPPNIAADIRRRAGL